jgi:hypothetical protein
MCIGCTMNSEAKEKNGCGCIQKFPDLPPWVRTANGTALCHSLQLYQYFVSQSCEFWRHNTICCFSTSVYSCKCIFRYRLCPETSGYTSYAAQENYSMYKSLFLLQIQELGTYLNYILSFCHVVTQDVIGRTSFFKCFELYCQARSNYKLNIIRWKIWSFHDGEDSSPYVLCHDIV